jgi:hypothetical protein
MAEDRKKRIPARPEKECITKHPWDLLKEQAAKEAAKEAAEWAAFEKKLADAAARGEIQPSYEVKLSPEEIKQARAREERARKERAAIDRYIAIRDNQLEPPWLRKLLQDVDSLKSRVSTIEEETFSTKTRVAQEARRIKKECAEKKGVAPTSAKAFAKQIVARLDKDPSVKKKIGAEYLRIHLPSWGFWPMSEITDTDTDTDT